MRLWDLWFLYLFYVVWDEFYGFIFADMLLVICPCIPKKKVLFQRRYTYFAIEVYLTWASKYILLCQVSISSCVLSILSDCNTNRLKIETNCCHCHSLMGCGSFRQQYEEQGRIIRTLFRSIFFCQNSMLVLGRRKYLQFS